MAPVSRTAAWELLDSGGLMISPSPTEPILELGPPSGALWLRLLQGEDSSEVQEAVRLFVEVGLYIDEQP